MRKLKIWFEEHPVYKEFFQLRYKFTRIGLKETLVDNVVPFYDAGTDDHSFADYVNRNLGGDDDEDDKDSKGTGVFRFTHHIESSIGSYYYGGHDEKKVDHLANNLDKISANVLFTKNSKLSLPELFNIAKPYFLKKFKDRTNRWWSNFMKSLTKSYVGYTFADFRKLFKENNCPIKLKSFKDLDNSVIYKYLKPEIFFDSTDLVILYGLGDIDYKLAQGYELSPNLSICKTEDIELFLNKNNEVLFPQQIKYFRISTVKSNSFNNKTILTYNCEYKNGKVRFIPSLSNQKEDWDDKEQEVKHSDKGRGNMDYYSAKYGEGNLVFSLSIEDTEKFLKNEPSMHSYFGLRFEDAIDENNKSGIQHGTSAIMGRFHRNIKFLYIDSPLRSETENRSFIDFFRLVGEKVTGVKEELVDRYVQYATKFYNDNIGTLEKELHDKFILMDSTSFNEKDMKKIGIKKFRSLAFLKNVVSKDTNMKEMLNDLEERQEHYSRYRPPWVYFCDLVVNMYILRHLKGNRIFDPTYENTFYKIEEGIKALLEERVKIGGKVCMKVK